MARANAAYYATHDPFADFTTSPEISQVFGELLGAWAAVTWGLLGRPNPVLLVEAGPGRGTLMADALRAVAQVAPDFHAALSLHLIETSPRLRAQQAARLPGATWHDRLDTVPHAPAAAAGQRVPRRPADPPVRPPRRGMDGAIRRSGGVRGGRRREEPPPPLAGEVGRRAAPPRVQTSDRLPRGRRPIAILELCEPARAFVADLAARCAAHPGAALFLDYGPEHSTPGD